MKGVRIEHAPYRMVRKSRKFRPEIKAGYSRGSKVILGIGILLPFILGILIPYIH